QDTGSSGAVISHNGGHGGHGALMYGTADGGKTLTAALNYVDDAELSLSEAFQKALQSLVDVVFGDERTTPAGEAAQ
ncbi:MAG: alkaline D-peptidase, partial [Nonomuraea sp.]|nr:alkaline D-peptidase [Nonomuraea sp.]